MLEAFILVLAVWLLLVTLYRVFRRRPAARPVHHVDPRQPVPVKRKPPRANVEHVLYVVYWAFTLSPCYFGISNDPGGRGKGHARRSWWWPFSDKTLHVIGRFDSRPLALAAEARAIAVAVKQGERLTNTHHNPRPVRKEDVRRAPRIR